MTCPHCWPPAAQQIAAANAARVAHEAETALLARLLGGPTDAEMPTQKPEKV